MGSERTVNIYLHIVRAGTAGCCADDIARELYLSTSVVNERLVALQARGFVVEDEDHLWRVP